MAVRLVRTIGTLVVIAVIAGCGSTSISPAQPPPSGVAGPNASVAPRAPSSAPSGTPGLSPVVGPTASPSPSPTASAHGALTPTAVTFVSANDGWVIGTVPCSTGSCLAVRRTTDGGGTWTAAPAPAAVPSAGIGQPGVSSIRFADPLDGWSFGSSLWATHDGGATWHPASVPGLPADSVMGLEASGGTVTVLVADTAGAIRLATSPVASDAWHVTGPAVSLGAGPVPRPDLVLSRSAGWLLEVDRTVIAPGARLVGGTWRTWQPPCTTANGPAILAAADASNLVAACDAGVWGPPSGGLPMGAHLFLSRDGGLTFTLVAGTLPFGYPSWIAMPAATTIAIAGTRTSGSAIAISADSGRTWRVVSVGSATEAITYLGFTTATQGVAIATDQAGGARLLMTRDGGRSWSPVAF